MPVFLDELRRIGFSGVQNFPTVGLIDGLMRLSFDDDHDTAIVFQPHGTAPPVVSRLVDRAKALGFTHVTIEPGN